MKTKNWLFLIVLLVLSIAFPAFAQTNNPTELPGGPVPGTAPDNTGLLLMLIPLFVPIIVAIGKFFLPHVPGWVLPILAPAIGALIDWLASLAMGTGASPLAAALLGSAGVGLREIKDKAQKRIEEGDKAKPIPLPMLLLCGALAASSLVMFTACNTTQQRIAFNSIATVQTAVVGAYDQFTYQVATGRIGTNDVPRVSRQFNVFQAATLIALDGVEYNTNALAPPALQQASIDFVKLVQSLTPKNQ